MLWTLPSVQLELSVVRALGGAQARTSQLLAFITAIAYISLTFLFNKCFNFSLSKKKKKKQHISLRDGGKDEARLFFVLRN